MIEFSAKVPDDEYRRFKDKFPMYGAVNWFINTALKEFNDKVEANPSLRQLVADSIEELVTTNRDTRVSIRSGD